jgi:hypothetical protein
VQGAAATSTTLLDALSERTDFDDVALYHLHLGGPCAFVDRRTPGLLSYSLFTGPALRKPVEEGRAEFVPVFLSDIPGLFATRRIPLDAALVQLSPPDAHGNCTLGTSVEPPAPSTRADRSRRDQRRMPRTHGAPSCRSAHHGLVLTSRPLHVARPCAPTSSGDWRARRGLRPDGDRAIPTPC